MDLCISKWSIVESCYCSWTVLTGGWHFFLGSCCMYLGALGGLSDLLLSNMKMQALGMSVLKLWVSVSAGWCSQSRDNHYTCDCYRNLFSKAHGSVNLLLLQCVFFPPPLCRSNTIYLRSCLQPWIFYSPSIRGWKAQAQPLLPDPRG